MNINTKKGLILIAFGIIGMLIVSHILVYILNLFELFNLWIYVYIPISIIRLAFIVTGILQIMGKFNVDKYFDMNKYLKIDNSLLVKQKIYIETGLKISLIIIILFSIGLLGLAFKNDVDGSHFAVFLISMPNMILLYFLNKKQYSLFLFILLVIQTLFSIFIITPFYIGSRSSFGLGIFLAYNVMLQIIYLIFIIITYFYIKKSNIKTIKENY